MSRKLPAGKNLFAFLERAKIQLNKFAEYLSLQFQELGPIK